MNNKYLLYTTAPNLDKRTENNTFSQNLTGMTLQTSASNKPIMQQQP